MRLPTYDEVLRAAGEAPAERHAGARLPLGAAGHAAKLLQDLGRQKERVAGEERCIVYGWTGHDKRWMPNTIERLTDLRASVALMRSVGLGCNS